MSGHTKTGAPFTIRMEIAAGDHLSIKPLKAPADAEAHRRQVREALVAAGLVLPEPAAPQSQPLSEQERAELARRLPAGRPLSEIIIEEREGR